MPQNHPDSFKTLATMEVGGKTLDYFSLPALADAGYDVSRLPVSIRILLENLLRHEDGQSVTKADIEALAQWKPRDPERGEIAFRPSRVLLQDFTGVPAVVDLAAMREAIKKLGGDPKAINPLQPVDLVIDHSVQVDRFGTADALHYNEEREFERNRERYTFLRWGQQAFANFRAVPPGAGIVHQVNLEYLGRVVFSQNGFLYPDTLVGTDSHTTMINGLGVLGWGVGGIEAEAAMLGQPISMLVPDVIGFRLEGALAAGTTATDLVLTVTHMLREKGVVGKFVEFFGPGLDSLTLADRATIANMAPEYGATMGFFPVDEETLKYLHLSGRSEQQIELVRTYLTQQGLFRTPETPEAQYTDVVELDLGLVVASLAGPKRPQDRVPLTQAKPAFRRALLDLLEEHTVNLDKQRLDNWIDEGGSLLDNDYSEEHYGRLSQRAQVSYHKAACELSHGSVVIAAITSCTNTSNPAVMVGAGLLAKKAVERGLTVKPWVKTSLAPGSKVVVDYLKKTGLLSYLEQLKFNLVGYGCTTCIGNSGPLPEPIAEAIEANELVAVSVLSGNRNFEGRINPHCAANYLASPPLVVAYALAGHMDVDLSREPLTTNETGEAVYLKDIWPSAAEIQDAIQSTITPALFRDEYAKVFEGSEAWQALPVPAGDTFAWDPDSTYVRYPPFFEDMGAEPAPLADVSGARCLALLGDSVTTDHISPAGSIPQDSPTTQYLLEHGVKESEFNSYGSRRGNHEVMMRGTFGNIRLRNQLAPGTEGGWTVMQPNGEQMSIYDAAMQYKKQEVPLVVLAGKEYGTGSSRDWAAKGTRLLGVKAVIAESFERIHRSNLIGMGVLPLQFKAGESVKSLGLTGKEAFTISGIAGGLKPRQELKVQAKGDGEKSFQVICRIDTPDEAEYYRHGGILQYVLRQIVKRS